MIQSPFPGACPNAVAEFDRSQLPGEFWERDFAFMAKFIDLAGTRYDRLSVVHQNGRDKHGNVIWLCLCDCGKQTILPTNRLKGGHTKSCGCLHRETARQKSLARTLGNGESAFNSLLHVYKRNAETRSLEWAIDKDLFRKLIKEPCYYCGQEPSAIMKAGGSKHNGDCIYNGLDRIDNFRGYMPENVRPCCKQCNIAKGVLSEAEFYEWISRVAARQARFEKH